MSQTTTRAIILCGTDEEDPPSRTLRAGPLSVELESGNLRYVRFAGIEVLRGIAFLVRDENWGTFTPSITDLSVEERGDSFDVTYRGLCADAKRLLSYSATIKGQKDGSLAFAVTATAETDVETNRAGFVVLHPLAGVAGRVVRIVHTGGRSETDRFPELIKPSQPVFDIRSLSHEIAPGVWATCTMEGDAFEMEDQRNWSDASYKTYIRPLGNPRPYTLTKGTRHEQTVRLSIAGAIASAAVADPAAVTVTLGNGGSGRLPAIGVGVPAEEAAHALAARETLRRLAPRLLVCYVDARRSLAEAPLAAYRALASATGAELSLEIIIPGADDPAAELRPVADAVGKAGLDPKTVTVSPASDLMSHQPGQEDPSVPPAERIFAAARAAFPRARLGGGVLAYFTELNRKRPPLDLFDFVTHTTCPIVHASDDRSVMETLETLPSIIASTKAFSGAAAYRIGPSAIGCRQNPYGEGTLDNPRGGRVCLSRVDPRQRALFGAAWTLGYLAAASYGGVEAVSMGAPTGPFGVIYRRMDEKQPYFDELDRPALYPAYHVLAGLTPQAGRALCAATASRPGAVAALALDVDGRTVVWLANLTAQPLTVTLAGLPKGRARAAIIDATAFERATTDADALSALERTLAHGRIALDAYAVARVILAA